MKVLLKNHLVATGKESTRNRSEVSPELPKGWARASSALLHLLRSNLGLLSNCFWVSLDFQSLRLSLGCY